MFFRSLIYPKIKKNEYNLQNRIKLSEIIVISNDENIYQNTNYFNKKKQKFNNSPYLNNTNNTNNLINNEENICDMV
jgi:hypothetical protein